MHRGLPRKESTYVKARFLDHVKVSSLNAQKHFKQDGNCIKGRRGRMLSCRDEVIDSDWWVDGTLDCLGLLHNLPHIPSTMTRSS